MNKAGQIGMVFLGASGMTILAALVIAFLVYALKELFVPYIEAVVRSVICINFPNTPGISC